MDVYLVAVVEINTINVVRSLRAMRNSWITKRRSARNATFPFGTGVLSNETAVKARMRNTMREIIPKL